MQKSKIITSKIYEGSPSLSQKVEQLSSSKIDRMEREIKMIKYPILPLAPAKDISTKIEGLTS